MAAGGYNTVAAHLKERTHSSQSQAPAHSKLAANPFLSTHHPFFRPKQAIRTSTGPLSFPHIQMIYITSISDA